VAAVPSVQAVAAAPTDRVTRSIAYLWLAACLGVYLAAGIGGLDHGPHRPHWRTTAGGPPRPAQDAASNHVPKDGHLYVLPPLIARLLRDRRQTSAVIATYFERPMALLSPQHGPRPSQQAPDVRYISSDRFTLDTRLLFLLLSLISPVAVFITLRTLWPRRILVAAVGAASLALSFEVLTHARWIAVEGLQIDLVALEMLLLAQLARPGQRGGAPIGLLLAAALAGLCVSGGPAGLVAAVPVVAAPFWLKHRWPRFGHRALRSALAFAVLALIAAAMTSDVTSRVRDLAEALHGASGTTVQRQTLAERLDRAGHVGFYIGLFMGSPSAVIASVFSAVSLYGGAVLLRLRRPFLVPWLLFALALVARLTSAPQLVVHEILLLSPLWAVAFASGLGRLGERLGPRHPAAQRALAAALLLVLLFHGYHLVAAAESSAAMTVKDILERTRQELLSRRGAFRISPGLARDLGLEFTKRFACDRSSSAPASVPVAMYFADHRAERWIDQRPGFVERTIAPLDVNYDWYATWGGRLADRRVVLLPDAHAREMNVAMWHFLVCRPRDAQGSQSSQDSQNCGAPPSATLTLEDLLASMDDLDANGSMDPALTSVRLASSYDRRSDDGDPFANRDRGQYISVQGDERVMLQARGPGVVTRITSANPSGWMQVHVDGQVVLEGPMAAVLAAQDLPVDDALAFVAARGHNLYLPIAFQRSCRITTDTRDGLYYEINYRTYAEGTAVEPFSAGAVDRAMCNRARRAKPAASDPLGTDNPSRWGGECPCRIETLLTTADDGGLQLVAPAGGGRITELRIEAGMLGEDELRGTELTLIFDGETTVRTPLGDFFHGGPGLRPFESHRVTVERDGTMIARWPMPFAQTAGIHLRSANAAPVKVPAAVVVEPAAVDPETLIFHAHWRPPTPIDVTGADGAPTPSHYRLAQVRGRGILVGTILNVANPSASWWGEGDPKVFVDGEHFPSHFGTGIEDYFGFAWCSTEQFARRYNGQIRSNPRHNGGHMSQYRWLALDAIPFRSSLTFEMEVLHWNSLEGNLENEWDSIAFFYLRHGSVFEAPEIGDHDFRIPQLPTEALEPPLPGAPPYGCGQGL